MFEIFKPKNPLSLQGEVKIYALSLCKHKMLKKENLKSLLGVLSALISAFFYTMDGILVKKVDSLGRCRLFYG